MSILAELAIFVAVEILIATLCVTWVKANIRVRKNAVFWFLNGEIDQRSDPVSYWFFAGPIVLMLAIIPTLLAYHLVFGT